MAKNYRFENNKLFIHKTGKYLEVPKPDLRAEIIEKANNFGHFQTESTYQRLKDTFYWKNIFDDIKKFVKKCTVCNRNNKEIVKYHPAQTSSISKIFKRVMIDLILGLPETDEGFNGLLNKSTNIVEKRIDIGKTVFLKCKGLLNKLEPRFKGPYKVSGHTKRGNYIIKNALNETLKDSYPRHKIKLVEDDSSLPEESAEIERIRKHKIILFENKTKCFRKNGAPNLWKWLSLLDEKTYFSYINVVLGEKFESLRTEPVKLTNDECKIMVITKKCRESPMNCDAEYRTYSANPKATFSCDILISESHLAVQASGIQICNVSVLTTVEGIYLSRKINQDINNKVPQSSTVEEMKELLLADNDYRVFKDIKQKNEILFNECLNFKSTLNLFSKNEDKYLTHFLKDGSSITFYTTMGTIYKADCLSVSEIEILTDTRNENTSQCFTDQPIIFNIKNSSKTGFLTFNNIISQVSNLVHCNRVIQYIQLVNQNYTIVRKNFQSSIVPNSKIQFFNFDYLGNKIKELNVHHNPLLLDGIDLLSTFQEKVNHELSAGTWYSHSSDTSNMKANVIETKMEIKNGLNMIFKKTFGIIALVCTSIFILLLFFLGCNFCVKCFPYWTLNSEKNKSSNNLEEQRKSEFRENQKNDANEQIEMITISKEKINVEPNIQNQEISEESLDSITNQLIFSTN
ncbi:Transposon Ty3-G Gag-Pol [Brachionus plicatilis]|uniref:Transposon Ty3-G Gag-Pol n=1 Tax=Brachionus plicatilis TaxID=10195 RepID=A0A3M7SB04_BRAPC|nr:Transposon Ty3-G Gag-Pol [Brachionus plicatilis]